MYCNCVSEGVPAPSSFYWISGEWGAGTLHGLRQGWIEQNWWVYFCILAELWRPLYGALYKMAALCVCNQPQNSGRTRPDYLRYLMVAVPVQLWVQVQIYIWFTRDENIVNIRFWKGRLSNPEMTGRGLFLLLEYLGEERFEIGLIYLPSISGQRGGKGLMGKRAELGGCGWKCKKKGWKVQI